MGVVHQPMRGLSRMTGGAIHWKQLDGLIMMFNGHFFKGLHKFNKEGRIIKKEMKQKKKEEKVWKGAFAERFPQGTFCKALFCCFSIKRLEKKVEKLYNYNRQIFWLYF